MHLAADTVSAQIPNYAVAVSFRVALDGAGDVAQPVALARLVNADPEALLGHTDEVLDFRGYLADRGGKGAVRLPSVQNHAAVYREDLTVPQRLSIRETMHHMIVRRGTDGGGEAFVALKGGRGARVTDHLLGEAIQLQRGDAGRDVRPERFQYLMEQRTRAPHLGDLFFVLERDHRMRSRRTMISARTISGACSPETSPWRPRSL
ncbi:hypothetical protein SDC9_172332 [bioreactor metagenome]|uniref:Uncharacterized protein n=1 Tax=bioreactor metagenome TaxID=1076179 RepID=A0A645GDF6_9ZZZZ